MPLATVIMRTKNSAITVSQTLKALYSQSFQDFDLLVVDSSSTDATLSILAPFPHRLISVQAQEYFPGKVLNQAIATTKTSYLVFLNSDAILLTPHGLDKLLSAFEDPQVVAAFGRQIPALDADGWVVRDYTASFPSSPPAPPWMPLSLCYAAMRREAWEAHPFYTWAWGSEDIEWGTHAKREGKTIAYIPDAVVMHSHNYTLRQLYGRRFIEGEADAYIYRGNYTKMHTLTDIVKAIVRDTCYHLKKRQWKDLFLMPIRRAVYYGAYYKGHLWGEHRLLTHNSDSAYGQHTVLKWYEK